MTPQEMLQDLNDTLALAGVTPVQGFERNLRQLNQAKNDLAAALELTDADLFTTRTNLTITAGTGSSVSLPTDFRRLITLTRTDSSLSVPCTIIDGRDKVDYLPLVTQTYVQTGLEPVVYIEGATLYCVGTVPAMTLELRYRAKVADMTTSAMTTELTIIPSEYHALVVVLAASRLIPASNPQSMALLARYEATLSLARVAMTRRISTGQHVIAGCDD